MQWRAVQANQIAIEREATGLRVFLFFRGYLIREEVLSLGLGEGVYLCPFGAIGLPAKTWRAIDRGHWRRP